MAASKVRSVPSAHAVLQGIALALIAAFLHGCESSSDGVGLFNGSEGNESDSRTGSRGFLDRFGSGSSSSDGDESDDQSSEGSSENESTSSDHKSVVGAEGFGAHIEGASVDVNGDFFATHFRNTANNTFEDNNVGRNVIGKVDARTGEVSAFFVGEAGAVFNGMRWEQSGKYLFLADVGQNKVVRVDLRTHESIDYCGPHPFLRLFGSPNDMALAKDGTLLLSGQSWENSSGALWACVPTSSNETYLQLLESDMGRTNGIALSPDDRFLYLTEAVGSPVSNAGSPEGQRIWRYDMRNGTKTEFFNFGTDVVEPEAQHDSDGMRTDIEGNLYVTRNGAGKVTVLSPDGNLATEIPLKTTRFPTNLAFGGADGKTLFVVGRCGDASWGTGDGCIEEADALAAGREWADSKSASSLA